MKRKFLKLYILLCFVTGCKATYKPYDFDNSPVINEPDYSNQKNWAVLPNKYPEFINDIEYDKVEKKADVFYVYPTLISGKKNREWNADINDNDIRSDIYEKAIKYQATAWIDAANLYAPFYRQAHLRVFNEKFKVDGEKALWLAYSDIKRSFQYYLKNYNNGKPFIIASHSQGALMTKELIKEFIDEKPLQKQLVAAYLIGTKIEKNEFKSIKPMTSPDEIGGFVSWNTYKYNSYPKKDNYERWFKNAVVTNPITWDEDLESNMSDHKGMLFAPGSLYEYLGLSLFFSGGDELQVYSEKTKINVIDGLIWATPPDIPGKFFLSIVKDYHFADISLFWKDISENSKIRVKKWLQMNK